MTPHAVIRAHQRRDLFHSYEECDETFYTAKKSHKMNIIGKGSIIFESESGLVEFQDVLHCEELASNLLSGFALQSKGVTVELGEENQLKKNDQTLCKGKLIDKAWVLELKVIKEFRSVEETEKNLGCINHRRMGHISKLNEGEPCETCMKAKATANRKKKKSANRKPTRGLVHMDLFGPVYGIYFGLVVYDFTDEVAIIKLKKKSDFIESWMKLADLWINQLESPIKLIKCDGGGEFVNERMQEWCRKQGCEMFIRNPYVKWQIGVAERRIRTVFEMANCMLLDSGLPSERYFADALFTAVYLQCVPRKCYAKKK